MDDDFTDDDDFYRPDASVLLAHAWSIARELTARDTDLVVSRVWDPDGNALLIVHDERDEFRVQLDVIGSVWVSGPTTEPTEYDWLDLTELRLPRPFVDDLAQHHPRLARGHPTGSRRASAYAFISQLLDTEIHSPTSWLAVHAVLNPGTDQPYDAELLDSFHGASDAAETHLAALDADVGLMGDRLFHQPLWVLERDAIPAVLVDSATGRVHTRGSTITLSVPATRLSVVVDAIDVLATLAQEAKP